MSVPRELELTNQEDGLRLVSKLPHQWLDAQSSDIESNILLSEGNELHLSSDFQVGITRFSLSLHVGSEIEYYPFGNDAICYAFSRSESCLTVTTKRNILDMNGSYKYESHFAFESELKLPDRELIDLVHVSDACSSEMQLFDGLYSFTNLAFCPEPLSPKLACTKGSATVTESSFQQVT